MQAGSNHDQSNDDSQRPVAMNDKHESARIDAWRRSTFLRTKKIVNVLGVGRILTGKWTTDRALLTMAHLRQSVLSGQTTQVCRNHARCCAPNCLLMTGCGVLRSIVCAR
jgi:hypothetical protein